MDRSDVGPGDRVEFGLVATSEMHEPALDPVDVADRRARGAGVGIRGRYGECARVGDALAERGMGVVLVCFRVLTRSGPDRFDIRRDLRCRQELAESGENGRAAATIENWRGPKSSPTKFDVRSRSTIERTNPARASNSHGAIFVSPPWK